MPQPRFYCVLSPEASEDDLTRLDSVVPGILKPLFTCGSGGFHPNQSVRGKGMPFRNEGIWSVLRFELILKGTCYFEVCLLGSTFAEGDALPGG